MLAKILVLALMLAPLLWVVFRARGRRMRDLVAVVILVGLHLGLYGDIVLGPVTTLPDTFWSPPATRALLLEWMTHGPSMAWTPLLHGGEPVQWLASALLRAELVIAARIGGLLGLAPVEIVGVYIGYLAVSFALFCFLLASALAPAGAAAFLALVAVLFGGLALPAAPAHLLSALSLAPLALLAAYLAVWRRRPLAWLGLALVCALATAQYLPRHLVLSVLAFLASSAAAAGLARLDPRSGALPRRERAALRLRPPLPDGRGALRLAAAIALCVAVAAPAILAAIEPREGLSPVQGGLALGAPGGAAPSPLNLPPVRYGDLVRPSGGRSSPHSLFHVGWVPVALALYSVAAVRGRVYWAFAGTLLLLAYLGLAERSLVWLAIEERVGDFYPRHTFPLAVPITVLVAVLAAFGLQRLPVSPRWKVALVGLALLLSLLDARPGTPALPEGPGVAAPGPRAPWVVRSSGPEADRLWLLAELPFTAGGRFAFAEHLAPAPALEGLPNEIENGSLERWAIQMGGHADGRRVPASFSVLWEGKDPRVEARTGAGHALDGATAAAVRLSPGGRTTLTYRLTAVEHLRGRHAALSACVRSRGEPAAAVGLGVSGWTAARRPGDRPATHTYTSTGRWECPGRTFRVPADAPYVEAAVMLSSPREAIVALDSIALALIPDARLPALADIAVGDIRQRVPDRLAVQVAPPGAGYLVRRERYHAGWSARVDGRAAPVERYAGLFQAVKVGPGPQLIGWEFHSAWAPVAWLHLAAVLLGAAWVAAGLAAATRPA